MKRTTTLASATTLAIGAVAAVGLTWPAHRRVTMAPKTTARTHRSRGKRCNRRLTPRSPTPARAGSPEPRSMTRRASTRSRSRWTNGDEVDVQLDEQFSVVSSENDGAGDAD